jgi:hypothetical protein
MERLAVAMEKSVTVNAYKVDAVPISTFPVTELAAAWICPTCRAEYRLQIPGDYRDPIYMIRDGDSCIAALDEALRAECSQGHPTAQMKSVDGGPGEVICN